MRRRADLQQQNRRHADPELPFPRLMMKPDHADQCADAAADEGEQKQRRLRYPEFMIDRLVLVDAEHDPGQNVDDQSI